MSLFLVVVAGVVVDDTQLSVSGNSLQAGSSDVIFTVSLSADYQSADAVEDNMWRISAYLTSNADGSGKRQLLSRQVLSPSESGQALLSGSRTRFYDLRTSVDLDEFTCEDNNYLCVELTRSPDAPSTFTFSGSSPNSLSSCERLNCAKKRKFGVKWFSARNQTTTQEIVQDVNYKPSWVQFFIISLPQRVFGALLFYLFLFFLLHA